MSELFNITDQKSLESMDHEKKLFLEGQKSSNRRGLINLNSDSKAHQDSMIVDEISKYYIF